MSDVVFLDGTTWSKSKLGMINDCMLSIGDVPFPEGTLISSLLLGTDGDTARRLVESTMIEVQSRGWYFNTDYDFKLVPDDEGFISVPPNVLKLDFGRSPTPHRYIKRNGRVYDMLNKTYQISNTLYPDIVWLVDYGELPPEAYEYISLRAARKFQQKVIGSTELANFTMLDEQDALTHLQRLQLQIQDYNLQDSRVSTRIHSGYLQRGLYNSKGRRDY